MVKVKKITEYTPPEGDRDLRGYEVLRQLADSIERSQISGRVLQQQIDNCPEARALLPSKATNLNPSYAVSVLRKEAALLEASLKDSE